MWICVNEVGVSGSKANDDDDDDERDLGHEGVSGSRAAIDMRDGKNRIIHIYYRAQTKSATSDGLPAGASRSAPRPRPPTKLGRPAPLPPETGSEPREGCLEALSSFATRPKSAEIRARAIWSRVFQKRVLRTRG